MDLKRFFINIPLSPLQTFELDKEDYRYIVSVMRLKEGDKFLINNNTEDDFLVVIKQINKQSLVVEVLSKTKNQKEPSLNLTVCQALLKAEKLEWVAQKITELGANKLIPFTTKHTVVKEHTQKLERLGKICTQASSQSGRAKTLKINPIIKLQDLITHLKDYELVLLAYEKEKTPLKEILTSHITSKNIALIIGPEGGFAKEEVLFLKEKLNNLYSISLGKRILRAESATIALLSIVMYETGELS